MEEKQDEQEIKEEEEEEDGIYCGVFMQNKQTTFCVQCVTIILCYLSSLGWSGRVPWAWQEIVPDHAAASAELPPQERSRALVQLQRLSLTGR